MKNQLGVLDTILREKRPEYYKKLQQPLSTQEIVALETKYSINLPEEVKALYRWKNGQQQDNYEALVNNNMFEPLENVLKGNQEMTGMIGYDFLIENWWNQNWLPLFSNGGGSYICYDMEGSFTGKKGQLLEYWNAYDDRNVIAPDLATFMGALNDYYHQTNVENFDGYFDISEHIPSHKKEFIVDKPIPKKY